MTPYYHEIALSKTRNVGPVTARQLISYCGSAEAVFKEKKSRLSRIPGIAESTITNIDLNLVVSETECEIEFIRKNGIQVLYCLEERYPGRLKHHADSPLLLYYKGNADLNHPRILAVVGTRKITDYGRAVTERLIEGLKEADGVIVSGLAFGVDTYAHRNSLAQEIPTVGVLGHGLDNLYPTSNRKLAGQMQDCGGLLTQFGIGTRPDKENFPLRNKVVAAMSDAIVVVESKVQGGSIITAEYGNHYNKDVFAIPGKISDEFSAGCNELIRTNKAMLLNGPEDLLENMQWKADKKQLRRNFSHELVFELNPEESEIVSALKKQNKIHIDQIQYQVKMTPGLLAGMLLSLEFRGVIKELPGKYYVLNE